MVGEQASKWFITVMYVSKVLTKKRDCSGDPSVQNVLFNICHLLPDKDSASVSNLSEGEEQLPCSDYVLLCVFQICAGLLSCPAHLPTGITSQ